MKKINILIVFLLMIFLGIVPSNLQAQTEEAKIKETINNYIEGTSYNKMEKIKSAFYEEADLFLDNREKTLWVVPIAEYVSWYEKKEAGKFNGRVGTIIAIDRYENIATAKAEILIPESDLRFVDLFLLKKIKGDWKIISKTAASEPSNKKGNRILFITSNTDFYGSSDIATGNSYSEIVNAYEEFDKAGYTIDFVSPEGGAIPLNYINTSEKRHKEYLYDIDFMSKLKNTLKPSEVLTEKYKAVYYVGGGSAMYGVPESEAIQKISMEIYEEHNGIISSVCHGTAGIVNLKTKDGVYLVKGKRVNGYPDAFERKDAEYFKQFPFLITKTIEERGGKFKYSDRNSPHVEVEGRLITGQNHLSAKPVALEIIQRLEKTKE